MNQTFTVAVGDFSGPLDLLLELIEKRKLSVNDVSLAQVTDDYIAFIENKEQLPVGDLAEFLLIASTLLLTKSKSLLPNLELTPEEEGDIQELQERLLQYKEIRRASRLLKRQWNTQPLFIPLRQLQPEPVFAPAPDMTVRQLKEALLSSVKALPTFVTQKTARVAKVINLDQMIERLTKKIQAAMRDTFSNMTKDSNKVESIVGFLALLELVKRGLVTAEQGNTFDDIAVEHTDHE